MSKNITFIDLTTTVPADYLNDLQETKTGIALGVKLSVSGGTTINLAGDPLTESQYSIRIGQKPRYGTSTVSVAGSGGAGGRDIFVTSANVDTPKAAAMELQINPAVPSAAFYRKIGELTWSGTAVTNLRLTTGVQANADQVNNFIFTPFLNTSTPLTVRGLSSQSADILRVEDSTQTAIFRVTGTSVIFGSVSSTGVNSFPAGTQALPSITFTGDTSTGIFSPGSGRVAISTTNANNFEVNGVSGILIGSSVSTTPITFGGDVSLSRGAANRLDLASGDSFNLVSGNLLFAGVQISTGQLSDTATLMRTSGSSFAGPVGFTTGTQASPSHYFVADTSTGIFSPAAGRVAISTTNANNFEVNAATGVLIGSTTPGTPLVFGGDVSLSRTVPNRLDLAVGDIFNLAGGAGSLQFNAVALASTHLSDSASLLRTGDVITTIADTPELSWPFPETDNPIELTISQAVSINTNTGTSQFATCANGVLMGTGAGSGNGGGIAGCTLEITSVGTGGQVIFESSTNGGSTWATLTVTSIATLATTTTATATGAWFVPTGSFTHIRIRATALTSGTIVGGIYANNCTGMLANQDYILYCPVPITLSYPAIGGLKLSGGRHIIMIGGEISIPSQGANNADTYSRAIYTEAATGVLHVEGYYLHGADLSDGFQLYSPEAIIQIQNCRVGNSNEPITSHDLSGFSDKHPDIIEGEGGWRELRVDKLTGWSNYQGIFLNQVTTKHGRFNELNRIDLNGAVDGVPTGSRQLFWQGDESGRTIVKDFYVQPHTEQTNLGFYNTLLTSCRYYGTTAETDPNRRQIIVAPLGLSNPTSGASATSSRYVSETMWPPKAAVVGHVRLGPPPNGEFVPPGTAGCSYVSPGYHMKDEARMFQEVGSPPLQGRSIRPSINKLKSWSMDPAGATTSSAPPTSGKLYLIKMPVEETVYELQGFVVNVVTAGVGLTTSQCWMGMYDRRGNKVATSLDLSTVFNSTGQKLIPLTAVAPYSLKYWIGGYGEFYFGGMVLNWATSGPKFGAAFDSTAGENAGVAASINLGVDGTGAGIGPTGKFVIRYHQNLAAQTTLPTSVFLSNSTPSSFAPLIGFN